MSVLDTRRHRPHVRHSLVNHTAAALLMVGMAGTLALSSYVLAGAPGMVAAALMMAVGVWFLPKMTPAALLKMFRAVPVGPEAFVETQADMANLARRAGLPMAPSLWVIQAPAITAFSVGHPEESGVGLSHRVLHKLSRREIAGILAHEISHIAGGDMTLLALGQVIGQLTRSLTTIGLVVSLILMVFGYLALGPVELLVLAFAPLAVTAFQLALSRNREFDADQAAARLTGDPLGLATALMRIEDDQRSVLGRFAWLSRRKVPEWLRTHPNTADRVAKLLG